MVSRIYKSYGVAIALFVLGLCLRLAVYGGYLSKNNNFWQVDSMTYHLVAQNIEEGNGISLDKKPHFYRVPGYSLFMAGIYKCVGSSPEHALWFQVVLAALIPVLIYLLALTMFPRRTKLALFAGLAGVVHLGLVLYSGFYMTETLFIIFFLLSALFFFRSGVSWSNLVAAGMFLGIASLVRPVGHYCVVLMIALLCIRFASAQDRVRGCFWFGSGWLSIVALWIIRNFLLTGSIFFHTLPGGHFVYLSASRIVMETDNVPQARARNMLAKEVHKVVKDKKRELGRPLHEIEVCNAHEAVARKYFINHPLITIKLWLTDMLRASLSLYSAELLYLESGRREFDYFDKDRTWGSMLQRYLFPQTNNLFLIALIYAEMLFFLLLLIGVCMALWGCIRGVCKRADTLGIVTSTAIIMLFIVIALAGGYARMRLPIEPFLIIVSLYGWSLHVSKRTKGAA